MTRLGTILQFRKNYPRLDTCVIVAEHRGGYHAVPIGSDEHKRFEENPNNHCRVVLVRKYLREQLENAGYIQPKRKGNTECQ